MRITKINLSKATCEEIGLGFSNGITIDNLGNTACFFGKIGVGKTRLTQNHF